MFRSVGPELYAAARFALYAERLVPLYDEMVQIQHRSLPKGDAAAYAALVKAKLAARDAITAMKPLLFPTDG